MNRKGERMRSGRSVTQAKLAKLDALAVGRKNLLIVMQDYPDPDAIASAAALREWAYRRHGLSGAIAFGGVVGRVENRALIHYLDLPMKPFGQIELASFDTVALVDTQPGTGNNALPAGTVPDIVLDHHPCRRATRQSPFTDIRRRYGATSTILYEYLKESALNLSPSLATALLYGIRSDTQDLGREACRADLDATLDLFRQANIRMYRNIQQANVPSSYFRLMRRSLDVAKRCGTAFVSFPGAIEIPDQIGEVAELLLRHEDCAWALCVGEYENRWLLSLRVSEPGADAGVVMRRLVAGQGAGGGHRAMAGGQMPAPANLAAHQQGRLEALLLKRFARLTRQTRPHAFRRAFGG